MMNIPPSEADRLDLYTYEGLLHNWNLNQSGEEEVETHDPLAVLAQLDRINADKRLTH